MTINAYGFGGEPDDPEDFFATEWAKVFSAVSGPVVRDENSFRILPVAGERRIVLSPGVAVNSGVLAISESNDNTIGTIPTPGGYRVDAIVLRTNWETGTVTPTRLSGASFGSPPTQMPAAVPNSFLNDPGVVSDQLLGWVVTNSANNSVQTFDARRLGNPRRILETRTAIESGTLLAPFTTTRLTSVANTSSIVRPFTAYGKVTLLLPPVPNGFAYGGAMYLGVANDTNSASVDYQLPGSFRYHTHGKASGEYQRIDCVVDTVGTLQPGKAVKLMLGHDQFSFGTYEVWDAGLNVVFNPSGFDS